jgi:hypothetical protein
MAQAGGTMKITDVKRMFKIGSEWDALNSYNPRANGRRRVVAVFATQFQWSGDNGAGGFTYWPQASQIREARDGFICFEVHKASQCDPSQNNWTVDDTLTLTQIA